MNLCFQVMENVDKWDFDVFKLSEVTSSRPLVSICYTILQVCNEITYCCALHLYLGGGSSRRFFFDNF